MKPQEETSVPVLSGGPGGAAPSKFRMTTRVGLMMIVLMACFGRPLNDLVRFSLHSDLYSHVILVPFISIYLVWTDRHSLPGLSAPNYRMAVFLLMAGTLSLASYWAVVLTGTKLAPTDSLALTTLAFLLFVGGGCGLLVGRSTLRAMAFPLGFLVFMVPLPAALTDLIETFLQHTSAATAFGFFKLSGTTFFHHDLVFQLPGISLQVAPECSGIHSSLALLITSVLAGHFFLRTPWKGAALSLSVIPLAILRNGFRIFTIGELCVHIGPDMVNSYIHRHGGPVFFILSLVPFFLLLHVLYKSDQPGLGTPLRISSN